MLLNNTLHKGKLIGQVRLILESTLTVTYTFMVTIATLAVHVQQAGAAHVIQQLVDMRAKDITDMLIEVIALFAYISVTMAIDVSSTTPTICHGQQLTFQQSTASFISPQGYIYYYGVSC